MNLLRACYCFGPFQLDLAQFRLTREGSPVSVQPKPLSVLSYLVLHRARDVTRDELCRAVWEGVFVSDAAVASVLRDLRRALGPDARDYVLTKRGVGYRFVHPVEIRLPEQTPEPAPSGGSTFVGRGDVLDDFTAMLAGVQEGRGRALFLCGEAGVGKTRLCFELAATARRSGFAVHVGRCLEEAGAPAYWPWIQIVRSAFAGLGSREIEDFCGGGREAVRLLRRADAATGREGDGAAERFRLFDGVVQSLAALARARPLLLVLDDLHRADVSSSLLLRHLVLSLEQHPIAVVAAYRDAEVSDDHALAPVLAELHSVGEGRRLPGLASEEIAELTRRLAGSEPTPEFVLALERRTQGNPLFVTEIVRSLAGETARATAVAAALPGSVQQAVRLRIGRIPSFAHPVLDAASVVGRESHVALLEAVCADLDARTVRLAVDEGIGVGLLEPLSGPGLRLRFSHALVRDAVYGALPLARRAFLHRDVGRAIERQHALDLDSQLDALANHFLEAAEVGEAAVALRYCRAAGEQALARAAYEEGAAHFEHALAALGRSRAEAPLEERAETRAEQGELLLLLGQAFWLGGRGEVEARKAFARVAEIAREIGEPDLLARAALGYAGRTDATPGVNRIAARMLDEALDRLPNEDGPLRAEVMARLGTELYYERDPSRSDTLTEAALQMAERTGDRALLAYVLTCRQYALLRPDVDPRRRLRLTERVVELVEAPDDVLATARQEQVLNYLEMGDGIGLRRALDEFERVVDELQQPFFRWMCTAYQGLCTLLDGRIEEADRLAHVALEVGQGFGTPNAAGLFSGQLFVIRGEQGRLAELEPILKVMAREQPDLHIFRAALTAVCAALGKRSDAREALALVMSEGLDDFPRDQNLHAALAVLAPAAAFVGDARHIERIYGLLSPCAGRTITVGHGATTYGAADRHLGHLAGALGDLESADEHYEAAHAIHRRLRAPLLLAHSQTAHAALLWKRGLPQDRERARPLVAEAVAAYDRLGLARRVAEARHAIEA